MYTYMYKNTHTGKSIRYFQCETPYVGRHETGNAGNAGHGPWHLVDPADMSQ